MGRAGLRGIGRAAFAAAGAISMIAIAVAASPPPADPAAGLASGAAADSLITAPPQWQCGWLRGVRIEAANIYRRDEPAARFFYASLANALHVTTRERVVRRGLGLRSGDRVCRDDVEAALRRLRGYTFLHADVRIDVAATGDSIDLTVRTRDVWTTLPQVQIGKQGGLWTWSAGLQESNLLGLGKALGVAIGHDEQQTYWRWSYLDQQFLSRDLAFAFAWACGSDLTFAGLTLQRPFRRPRTPWGLALQAEHYAGAIIDHRGGLDGPEWDRRSRLVWLWAGPRVGGGERTAVRLAPTLYLARERYSPPEAGEPLNAGGCAGAIAGAPLRDRDIRAVGLTLDGVREAYTRRRGIDVLAQWEDFNLGTEVRLLAAWSARRLGAARDGLYFRLVAQQGLAVNSRVFLRAYANGYGAAVDHRLTDSRLTLSLRGYAGLNAWQTLALRLETNLTRELAPQDLPALGAQQGLRGFDAYRFWGECTALGSLEDRLLIAQDVMGLFSIGVAAFVDAGTNWVRGCERAARPRAAAGVGLRLQGSRTGGRFVTRVDLGYPIVGAEESDGWVLSLAAGQAF
jgi:hypothetical protein